MAASKQTALDRYVAKPDPNYKFELKKTIPGKGFTAFVLELTSQQYLTEKEIDKPVWRHWLTVVRPDRVKSATGFLFITGGSITSAMPAAADAFFSTMAVNTGSVTAELRMVPNQPLIFAGETKGRVEDSFIAYTWDKFLRTGDEKWPARLPMTKAAVKAMDAVTEFSASAAGGKVAVSKFVVSGASKRGWTTWTAAAVDKRVVAIVPLVIDMLNLDKSFAHHWRVYGNYSPAIKDYIDFKTMDWAGTKENRKLLEIEEPYQYRDRLTMPKYTINATGDEFFIPDSWQFYWKDLKGEKHIRYVPNTKHNMQGTDVRDTLGAFYQAVVEGKARPKYDWRVEKDGTITMKSETRPEAVKLWRASNPKARDFRLDVIGKAWTSADLKPDAKGVYRAKVTQPSAGYSAYFIEMTYWLGGPYPFKATTGVRVTPNVYPYPARKATPPR